MSKDIRVVLVKLADRLHNMRNMGPVKKESRKKKSKETMDIFVPIANRLGLAKLKSELEDLCFQFIEPELYDNLQNKLQARSPDHNEFIERFGNHLKTEFSKKGIKCQVYGRVKYLVSVYRKMVSQNIEFDQVHDLLAFRVLVEDLGQCYSILGLTHALYPHHPNRLKDYIAQPKSNGYQSLHTVVLPEGRQVEIQIRTKKMHQIAELGIAAHWRYKEGHLTLSKEDIQKIARLRALFEAAKEITDSEEFLETVKVELFSLEIFVFTPRGDLKIFPKGSTALDFAYAIHTEVGDKCVGAKVDGRIVPLRYELQNGDRVEVMTSVTQKPSRDWLDIAQTSRALAKIRRSVREEEREKALSLGEELLEKSLKNHELSISKLQKNGQLIEIIQNFSHRNISQLYIAIGSGNLTTAKIITFLLPDSERKPTSFGSFFSRMRSKSTSPVLINGEDDVLTSFAKCCNPLPGEQIEGFITRGHGISIHKADCKQYLSSNPDRKIQVQWQTEAKGQHTASLRIECSNQMGLLADIGAACKIQGINISNLETNILQDDQATITLLISILHISQVKILQTNLLKIKGINRVLRL